VDRFQHRNTENTEKEEGGLVDANESRGQTIPGRHSNLALLIPLYLLFLYVSVSLC
jgi:hypothetical protein